MQYLYVMQSKDAKYFKIGITNNVETRLKGLQKCTPFELYPLLVLGFANRSTVKELERLSHAVLLNHHSSVSWEYGKFDGYTEWVDVNRKTKDYIAMLLEDFYQEWNLREIHPDLFRYLNKPLRERVVKWLDEMIVFEPEEMAGLLAG